MRGGPDLFGRLAARVPQRRESAAGIAEAAVAEVRLPRLCGALHSRGYAEFGTMRSNPGFRLLKHL